MAAVTAVVEEVVAVSADVADTARPRCHMAASLVTACLHLKVCITRCHTAVVAVISNLPPSRVMEPLPKVRGDVCCVVDVITWVTDDHVFQVTCSLSTATTPTSSSSPANNPLPSSTRRSRCPLRADVDTKLSISS